jgi:hypothetical protein
MAQRHDAHLHEARPRRRLRSLAGAALLIATIAALPVWAFTWGSARLAPRDLRIGVTGPAAAVGAIQQRLAQQGDAFDVHAYLDEQAARAAIDEREVYGAIVASPQGVTVLTASAASPAVAQLLREVAASPPAAGAGGGAGSAVQARVVDVAPADPQDPRGAVLSSALLPLVIVSVLTALMVMAVSRPGLGQASGLIVASAIVGLVAIGIVQGWLGALGGNWVVNAGVLGLTALAVGSAAAGLAALLGEAGLVIAAPLMVFIGNPFSGVSSAPELLPRPVGLIGQLLPPGAGGNLLRSTAFFAGGGAAGHLTVLVTWALLGLVAVAVGALLHRQPAAQVTHALDRAVAGRAASTNGRREAAGDSLPES